MKNLIITVLSIIICTTGYAQKKIAAAYIENGNVFVKYSNNSNKQLTFSSSDMSPVFLKKENAVVFIRDAAGNIQETKVKKIMKVSCTSLVEKTISDKKPYKDGVQDSRYILGVNNPTLSLDENYLYFTTEKFVTSNELVKVNLSTGVWTEMFPAMQFELIKSGQYKGLFLIGKSEMKGAGGRRIYYYLVNDKDETLKEFNSEDNYLQFKTSVGIK